MKISEEQLDSLFHTIFLGGGNDNNARNNKRDDDANNGRNDNDIKGGEVLQLLEKSIEECEDYVGITITQWDFPSLYTAGRFSPL